MLAESSSSSEKIGFNTPSIRIHTTGCRVNIYDSSVIQGELVARGYQISSDDGPFDAIVVNACTVTQATDAATRRFVRKVRRDHPDAAVVITGCYAEVAEQAIREQLGGTIVVPNRTKFEAVDALDHWFGKPSPPTPRLDPVPDFGYHTRFFYKVQEGCDVRCTFCIIPDARGSSRSVPADEVVQTVRRALDRGYQEIILSGVHLGSFGRDQDEATALATLIRRILAETDLPRLRLGSLEPWGVRPPLLEILAEQPRFLPSLHLPLQSGCEATLRRMKRPMSAARYQALLESIRNAQPDCTFFTDIIAGFPGETDGEFEQSLTLLEALPLTHLHVFPYSPRPGTPAINLPDPVPEGKKRERVQRLIELNDRRFSETLSRRIGLPDSVLVESGGRGHTRQNLPVQLIHPDILQLRGQIRSVVLKGKSADRLIGDIYGCSLENGTHISGEMVV